MILQWKAPGILKSKITPGKPKSTIYDGGIDVSAENNKGVPNFVYWALPRVVHNCTIFLCSLDVRNIVQGGDPLYAGFFSTQGSGGYT